MAVLTVHDEVSTMMMGSRARVCRASGLVLSEGRQARVEGFTLIEMLVVIVIIMVLAGLLLPTAMRAICNGRQAGMEALLSQLEQACSMYKNDHADFPKSTGAFESSVLVTMLSKPSLRHGKYFEFKESQIDKTGNIVNAVHASEDTVKYRNNYMNSDPKAKGLHNKSGIDMWCMGCDKVGDSINNWD
jgi:prepilin-type N-terminal cleavage/methylation domain-containing protein